MPKMGFEPTITASERAKTVHALDRSATVAGPTLFRRHIFKPDDNIKIEITEIEFVGWARFSGSGQVQMLDSSEDGKETSGSVKG
jgi:hypothetical protein